MDWNLAIERNREALKRILASLVDMAGLDSVRLFALFRPKDALHQDLARAEKSKPSPAPTLPRYLHRAVLRVLRPAEAATRRLIIVMARGMAVTPTNAAERTRRPNKPKPKILRNGVGTGTMMPPATFATSPRAAPRTLALPLLDPLRCGGGRRRPAASWVPRISVPGLTERAPVPVRRPPAADDPVSAARLNMRLTALASALDDLPAQVRRFARWRSRRDLALAARLPHRLSPLRPGPAYGRRRPHSRRRAHEVDEVLRDLHYFAFCALCGPDTS